MFTRVRQRKIQVPVFLLEDKVYVCVIPNTLILRPTVGLTGSLRQGDLQGRRPRWPSAAATDPAPGGTRLHMASSPSLTHQKRGEREWPGLTLQEVPTYEIKKTRRCVF